MSRARDTAGIIQYNKISIDSNNAVGIGSSIPDCKLDINGGLRVAGVTTFQDSLDFTSDGTFNTSSGVNIIFQDQGSDKLHFEVSGQNIRPNNANTGEVGNTSYPFAKVTAQNALITNVLTINGGANVSGVVTTSALKGFDYLQAPHSESTVNFAVTVAAKTTAHRYEGTGSSNGYVIDGVQSPFLTLTPGITYRFTLDSSDMSSHPFRFYLEADKTTAYTTNVTSTATYTEITVTDSTPTVLHYQCSSHGYMGNAVQVNSNVVNTNYAATLRDSLTVSGTLDVNGTDHDIVGAIALDHVTVSGIVTAASFSGSAANLTDLPEGTNVLKAMLFV